MLTDTPAEEIDESQVDQGNYPVHHIIIIILLNCGLVEAVLVIIMGVN